MSKPNKALHSESRPFRIEFWPQRAWDWRIAFYLFLAGASGGLIFVELLLRELSIIDKKTADWGGWPQEWPRMPLETPRRSPERRRRPQERPRGPQEAPGEALEASAEAHTHTHTHAHADAHARTYTHSATCALRPGLRLGPVS